MDIGMLAAKIFGKIVDEMDEELGAEDRSLRTALFEGKTPTCAVTKGDIGFTISEKGFYPFNEAGRSTRVQHFEVKGRAPNFVKGPGKIYHDKEGAFLFFVMETILDELTHAEDLIFSGAHTSKASLVRGKNVVAFRPVRESEFDELF